MDLFGEVKGRVLAAVATIPYGELWTYGDVAGMAGSSRAARAAISSRVQGIHLASGWGSLQRMS